MNRESARTESTLRTRRILAAACIGATMLATAVAQARIPAPESGPRHEAGIPHAPPAMTASPGRRVAIHVNREAVDSEENGQGAESDSGGSGTDGDRDGGEGQGRDRSAPDTPDPEASSG